MVTQNPSQFVSTPVAKINIFQYTHVADYLNAVFREKTNLRPGYSIRAWARSMGLTTASLLSAVLRKERRVSDELADKLSEFLRLDEKERKYFAALIVFSGPRSPLEDGTVREYLGYLKDLCLSNRDVVV